MSNTLRKKAETILTNLKKASNVSPEEFDKIVHDLHVHQIELELQNDELKRATEELALNSRRYTDLFEYAPVGYMLLNDKAIIQDVNLSSASMLGIEKKRLIGKPLPLYVHPDHQDALYLHIQSVLESEQKLQEEIRIKNVNGVYFYVQIQSMRDKDLSSNTYKIRLALIDISRRKEAEKNLLRFRAALDSSADNIFLIDYTTKRILDANQSACFNLGYSKEELLQMDISKINPILSTQEINQILNKVISQNTEKGISLETKHRRKDGSIINVEIYVKGLIIENEKIIVTVARDTTERIRSQEKLQKYAEELKETNTSKDKFLSIISHDLRGPFLGLNGYTQMLIEDYDDLSKEEIMSFLQKIHDSSRDLYTLVDNLLKWSRLELGKTPYEPMTFNLYEELDPLVKLLSGVAEKKGIQLTNKLQEGLYPLADRLMLISVTQNLVSNAIKFTRKGGNVVLSSEEMNNQIFVKVQDDGVGIRPEVISKLFTLNKEFTSKGTEGEKGTGFGLLIAREMLKKMGGDILVESEPDKGSTFSFYLQKGNI